MEELFEDLDDDDSVKQAIDAFKEANSKREETLQKNHETREEELEDNTENLEKELES